jgi:hypothetical protein
VRVGVVWPVSRGCWGCVGCFCVSDPAQVEPKSERVSVPAWWRDLNLTVGSMNQPGDTQNMLLAGQGGC